jgi:hypothetical protein
VLLCLKTETVLASEMSCFFEKLDDGQSPPTPQKKEDYVSYFLLGILSFGFLYLWQWDQQVVPKCL